MKKNGNGKKQQPPRQKKGNGSGNGRKKIVSQFIQPKTLSTTSLRRGPALSGHHKQTCSILDPFCVHARGAKVLDGIGGPTIAIPLKGLVSVVAASTSGRCRFTFVPSLLYSHGQATGGALPNWTNPAAWTAAPYTNTLVTTYAKEARIVSFGIMFRSAMTATTAKGNIIVTVESQPGVNDSGLVAAGAIVGESQMKTLAAGTEFSWVSRPLGPSATLMKPMSQFTSTQTDFDWTSCVVEVVGGDISDAIPYLTAELFMNIEFTSATTHPTTGNPGLSVLATAPPPPNPVAMMAARKVQTQAPSFIDGMITDVSNKLGSMAMTALTDIGKSGIAGLMTLL